MLVVERRVRFEDVDPAGIVFFGKFATYAHEAMEAFFDQVDGGYAGLIMGRRIGFPAVKLEADYKLPLRYGDVVQIETTIAKLGTRSAVFRYVLKRGSDVTAELRHTVVVSDLEAMASCDMPPDVRSALAAHVE